MDEFFSRLKTECICYNDMLPFLPPYVQGGRVSIDHLRKLYESQWNSDEYKRTVYHAVCDKCVLKPTCKLIQFRHYSKKNIVVNYFADEVEIVFFKRPLNCIEEVANIDVDSSRNYVDINGVLFPKDENISNAKFLDNMANSARQSIDAFWGYALSNKWNYFITLTTDKLKVDRYDDDEVKRLWRICRQRIQRYDKNAKLLIIPERHTRTNKLGEKALHFHGLVAMRDFELRPFKLNGVWQTSKTGAPLYNFPFWDFGQANCAIIYPDDFIIINEDIPSETDNNRKYTTNQRRVVAYLNKYMSKEFGSVGYGQKHFYRTHNVVAKEKEVFNWTAEEVAFNCSEEHFFVYKEDDERVYFRQKNVGEKIRFYREKKGNGGEYMTSDGEIITDTMLPVYGVLLPFDDGVMDEFEKVTIGDFDDEN
ncbi:MAG: hypothetical protein K2J16_04000 [Clostridia bacterium]|nr:hypothetical protein [Clostridia bacterium]